MERKTSSKLLTTLKVLFFAALASATFNAYAHQKSIYYYTYSDVYYGNPNRPYTIWVPGHCDRHGCWREGYYIKILGCVHCGDIVWAGDHWQVRPYRIVAVSK